MGLWVWECGAGLEVWGWGDLDGVLGIGNVGAEQNAVLLGVGIRRGLHPWDERWDGILWGGSG